MIVCNEVCLKGFTHWVLMGFRLDSNFDGVLILIFCYGFLFFGFGWLDFGIPIGFGLDSDGLVWVGMVGMVVVWWWRGGDCSRSCLVVVGHCGGFVWLSLVTMAGLFGRCWS